MKQVLVLGAGLVARPLVRYLLNDATLHITVADRVISKAAALVDGHTRGSAVEIDVTDIASLHALMEKTDIVVSLLPWTYHMIVARECVELGKNLVTTSYIKDEMRSLHGEVQKRGLLFLNEIGVDPGIDHMAAMRIINAVKAEGGRVDSFFSYCGGLPSLGSNTNPLGYKFSWSPVGVMLAATNSGRYKRDGVVIDVPAEQLFEHYWLLDVPGSGTFEAYVNRDALPYAEIYGIEDATGIYRGTLRNIGHCQSWNYFKQLGLLDRDRRFDLDGTSPARVLAALAGGSVDTVESDVAAYLSIPAHAITLKKMRWLGLFSDTPLGLGEASAFDMFAHVLKEKLVFLDGQTDLLVQHHEFLVTHADGRREKIMSTMVDEGIPGGDSAMSRTVSLPAAIATRLIVHGAIHLTGVHLPVSREIYEPVLQELETMDIALTDRRVPLP